MKKMHFCKDCDKLLKLEEKDGKLYALCSCGSNQIVEEQIVTSERQERKPRIGRGIAQQENSLDGFPHICSKCGYDKADITDLGAPYGDESNIYLLKCKKCGHTERQTDGTSNSR